MMKPAAELGPVLTGRAAAEALRHEILEALRESSQVVVDFDGVVDMSPSFADELFAKLPAEVIDSGAVSYEHLDEDLTSLVRFVVSQRRSRAS